MLLYVKHNSMAKLGDDWKKAVKEQQDFNEEFAGPFRNIYEKKYSISEIVSALRATDDCDMGKRTYTTLGIMWSIFKDKATFNPDLEFWLSQESYIEYIGEIAVYAAQTPILSNTHFFGIPIVVKQSFAGKYAELINVKNLFKNLK